MSYICPINSRGCYDYRITGTNFKSTVCKNYDVNALCLIKNKCEMNIEKCYSCRFSEIERIRHWGEECQTVCKLHCVITGKEITLTKCIKEA